MVQKRNCFLPTQTRSATKYIETQDLYQDVSENKELFDLSNYKKSHELYDNTNDKVLGKMKDECGGAVIEKFIRLKPKMYSLKYGSQEKKTAKGVRKCVLEKQLKHEAYLTCLENRSDRHATRNEYD